MMHPVMESYTAYVLTEQTWHRFFDNYHLNIVSHPSFAEVAQEARHRCTEAVYWDVVNPAALRQLKFYWPQRVFYPP